MSVSKNKDSGRTAPTKVKRTHESPQVPHWLQSILPGKKIPEGGFTNRQRRLIRIHHVRSSSGTLLLLTSVLLLIMSLAVRILPSTFGSFEADALGAVALIRLIVMVLAIFLPVIAIIVLYRLGNQRVSGRYSPSGSLGVLAALAGIPIGLIFIGLNNVIAIMSARLGWQAFPATSIHNLKSDRLLDIILIAVVFVALPAFLEEILFRGVIQAGLSSTGRGGIAVLLQAIPFALFYPWGIHVLVAFLLGLALGFLRWRTDSLLLPILTRLLVGFTIFTINRLLPVATATQDLRGNSGQSLLYASIVATVVASLTLIPIIAIMHAFNEREQRQASRRSSWVNSHTRVLVPVKDSYAGPNILRSDEQKDKKPDNSKRVPPVGSQSEPGFDDDVLPAAASLWFPSDWKFAVGVIIMAITYILNL